MSTHSHGTFHSALIALGVCAALSSTAGGCGCGSDDGEGTGAAPVIADLILSPSEVPTGMMTNVDANFTFEDEEGDIDQVAVTLSQAGAADVVLMAKVGGAAGMTAGPARVTITLLPTVAGEIDVVLHLIDERGNESNLLSAQLTATDDVDDGGESSGGAVVPLDAWLSE